MGRRLTCAALLLGLALTGCTDDPEPQRADPTVEPTAETTAPSSPPTSTSNPPSPNAPEDAIAQWQASANAMQVSGESAEFRALTRQCAPCDDLANRVDRIYRDGGFIETAGGEIVSIEKYGEINGWPTFDVIVDNAPTRFRESASSGLKRYGRGTSTVRISLESSVEGWLVRSYGQVVP